MSETKREYLRMDNQAFNHDAGSGVVVGAFGHPNSTIGNNWLGTVQGDQKFQREGDSIYTKYIDYSIRYHGYANRPSQRVRFLIVKGTGNNANNYSSASIADWFVTDGTSTGSGNLITQPIDTTKYTVLKDVIIYPLSDAKNTNAEAAGDTDDVGFPVIRGRVKTGYKVQYATGTTYPSRSSHRIQFALIPYADNNCGPSVGLGFADLDLCHYFCDF